MLQDTWGPWEIEEDLCSPWSSSLLGSACTWSAQQDNWLQGKNCWCCQEEELKVQFSVNCNTKRNSQQRNSMLLSKSQVPISQANFRFLKIRDIWNTFFVSWQKIGFRNECCVCAQMPRKYSRNNVSAIVRFWQHRFLVREASELRCSPRKKLTKNSRSCSSVTVLHF